MTLFQIIDTILSSWMIFADTASARRHLRGLTVQRRAKTLADQGLERKPKIFREQCIYERIER